MANKVTSLPTVFRKLVANKLSTAFTEATEIVTTPMLALKPQDIIIKTRFLGINASDINVTAGRYLSKDAVLPFDTGLEAVGEIVDVGAEVKHMRVGQTVACLGLGAFAEYLCLPAKQAWTLPKLDPKYLPLLISGRTASIALDKVAHLRKKETVLITAAAGGTGSLAVQYAKTKGCHVIGTCSSDDKVNFLKELKCDRPVNYKKEKLEDVLKEEYPNGIDVVWETIGDETFKIALKNLAVRGRLVIIGYITKYKSEKGYQPIELGFLPRQLLTQSSSVAGFLLNHYEHEFSYYHVKLLGLYETNRIKVFIDNGDHTSGGMFMGLESIARAVQYLHSGTSMGKVIVTMPG